VKTGSECLLTHRAKLSLNSRCLKVSHAARLTCHGVICTNLDGVGSRRTCSGMRSSLKYASHQFECINSGRRHSWYAFFNHILSSSQLRGEDLSRAFFYTSAATEGGIYYSQTCHADALDTWPQDRSQTRRPSAVSPAAQTAMGDLRAPLLPGGGEPRTGRTWIAFDEGQAREGAARWEGGSQRHCMPCAMDQMGTFGDDGRRRVWLV
jgi:hypothetical protein